MKVRFLLLIAFSVFLGVAGHFAGLTRDQVIVVCIFSLSVLGTLLFWDYRLSFVFIGTGVLFLTRSVDLEHFLKFASLDVILFLIGMMIVVAMMKESGVFNWLLTRILKTRNISGLGLFIIILTSSALLSAVMGEVSSIIVMMAVILDISALLDVKPTPLVISSVITTNIGSASTVLGNPIGVLLALRGGLTFEDFLTRALPLSLVILVACIAMLCLWYRTYIRELSARLSKITRTNPASYTLDRDKKISITIFTLLIIFVSFHNRLEILFGIGENNLLIMLPIIFAGIVMAYRQSKVQYYMEHEVEWYSLLFFIFLFAQAGVIQSSGVAEFLAGKLVAHTGNHPNVLVAAILFSSGILSGVLDNTVVVATYIPVVKSLHMADLSLNALWWSLLFGACLGGNITAIGSTANIVALGLLEKQRNIKADFLEWLKLGLVIGAASMLIAYLAITAVPIFSK